MVGHIEAHTEQSSPDDIVPKKLQEYKDPVQDGVGGALRL